MNGIKKLISCFVLLVYRCSFESDMCDFRHKNESTMLWQRRRALIGYDSDLNRPLLDHTRHSSQVFFVIAENVITLLVCRVALFIMTFFNVQTKRAII